MESLVVGLAQAGDREAFTEIVYRRQSWIRNLLRRCCGDVVLADDLAQQTFLQAFRKIVHLRRADRLAGWLKRIAMTTWLQHLRAEGETDTSVIDGQEQEVNELTSERMDIDAALARLSPIARTCVVLSYHEGMTHTEIAVELSIPLGTVKSHVKRGSEKLQQLLASYASG
jgi:RNA polymerase sigma-70 factor (ECF subfamily)